MGHASLVTLLLKKGANVHHTDNLNRGLISACALSPSPNLPNKSKILKALLAFGAPLNSADIHGRTALILAALNDQVQTASLLLDLGADIDFIDNNSYTAIAHACKADHSTIVDFLLRKNAATHILDSEGRSILSIAASCNASSVLELLMARGLDEMHRCNAGWTPLHEAAHAGHTNVVQMLLDYGSDVEALDNEGRTSLFLACVEGHLSTVKTLLMRSASLATRTHQGISPLRAACMSGHVEVVEYLVVQPGRGDVDCTDADGRTTLLALIQSNVGNSELLSLLLSNGANPLVQDSEGRTCLHLAVAFGHEASLKLLLSFVPDLETIDKSGCTPLQTAVQARRPAMVGIILSSSLRVGINNQDRHGQTALSLASQQGNEEIVAELLKHGASIYASASNPIKVAHQNGHDNVVRTLQQWAAQAYNPLVKKESPTAAAASKSIESFQLRRSATSVAYTPTSFSTYIKTPSPSKVTSISKFELLSQNKSQRVTSTQPPEEEHHPKSSRFKIVKDKLLRKPSVLSQNLLKQSKSIDSSVSKILSSNPSGLSSPASPKSMSFRVFISSLKKPDVNSSSKYSLRDHQQPTPPILIQRSTSFVQRGSEVNKSTKFKSSVASHSSFYQKIRKKFSFMRPAETLAEAYDDDDNDEDFVFKGSCQVTRNINDIFGYGQPLKKKH